MFIVATSILDICAINVMVFFKSLFMIGVQEKKIYCHDRPQVSGRCNHETCRELHSTTVFDMPGHI